MRMQMSAKSFLNFLPRAGAGQPRTTWMKNIQGDLSSMDRELLEDRVRAQNQLL